MAKTEVILIENVVGLGAESDQVKVAAGYARNFLYPQRLAVPLNSTNKRRIEALRQRRAEREAHEFNSMNELAKSISKLTAVVSVKTGDDGKMFGSVTAATIADQLHHQFEITLDKKKIHLDHPIRTVGDHEVQLRLHSEVSTTLKVRVESSNPTPAATEASSDDKGRGRGGRDREGRDRDTGGRDVKGGVKAAAAPAPAEQPKTDRRPKRETKPRS
jgi:large subunit ribosomal protein L9